MSKLFHGFVKIEAWISIHFYIVLSKLMHEFLYIVSLICQINTWIFSMFLHGFVKIDVWISLSCYMNLSKFLHVFIKVVTYMTE